MIQKLYDLAFSKDVTAFAWDLYCGVSDGSISLSDLISLIKMLGLAEIRCSNDEDSDPWAFLTHEDILNSCSAFAFCVLKKRILTGTWRTENGILSDGKTEISVSSLREVFPADPSAYYDPASWYQNRLDEIEYPDSEKETFLLAPLDFITEENALVVFNLLIGISENRLYSADSLKDAQIFFPEQCTHEQFVKKLSASNHTQYLYFFLESANPDEMTKEGEAGSRAEEALTVREAVFTATEQDFWLCQRITFPYTVYMLLTEQIPDPGFLPDEPDHDPSSDERFSEEDRAILEKAAAGDPESQNTVADLYLSGRYPDEDGKRAAHWLKLAAENGVASAQSNYGVALQRGLGGIETDNSAAINWFLKAAEQGLPEAQLNLGLAYSAGRGVERDISAATEWFRKAADGGNEMARMILENGLIINS